MKKINKAVEKLKTASKLSETYYNKPLVITYSGGKDSDVLLNLALNSGINFKVVNSHTTLDAPQTVYHIRQVKKELENNNIEFEIKKPRLNDKPVTMWELIKKYDFPPTRLHRYCCKVLKETSIPNSLIALGVRAEESTQRKNRGDFEVRGKTKKDAKIFTFEHTKEVFDDALDFSRLLNMDINKENAFDCSLISNCKKKNDIIVNPIIEWTHSDIWEYIRSNNITYNPLYDMGYQRVGCIGCPEASFKQKCKQFHDFPKYKENYIKTFDEVIKSRKERNKPFILSNGKEIKSGEELFDWWIEKDKYCGYKGQLSFNFD